MLVLAQLFLHQYLVYKDKVLQAVHLLDQYQDFKTATYGMSPSERGKYRNPWGTSLVGSLQQEGGQRSKGRVGPLGRRMDVSRTDWCTVAPHRR